MGDAGGLIADCVSDAHVFVWPGSPTIERNDLGNVLSGTASGGIIVTGASRAILERNEIDPSVHSPSAIGSPGVRPTLTTATGATR